LIDILLLLLCHQNVILVGFESNVIFFHVMDMACIVLRPSNNPHGILLIDLIASEKVQTPLFIHLSV
jgi:hypothetical protein